ncbi:MAG: serine/threonine protein phosphatase [Ruminococcaceae bacterium]|nr:serine/threonine protein phosphatase [Oscillospiraceae bacterium]
MALFVIGDLHLSLGADKPMDIFRGWQDYQQRLEQQWQETVSAEDTVVIPGDVSWAMSLEGTREDFTFLNRLNGQKLILKGNHDYWWCTRRKMDAFFEENGFHTLRIVHNDAVAVEGVAVCGTRGWFYDAEEDADRKVLLREVGRLRTSIAAAKATGCEPLVFLHYPPVTREAVCEELFAVLREEGVTRCYYGHLHGPSVPRAFCGVREGIRFQLVSGDALGFRPLKIL